MMLIFSIGILAAFVGGLIDAISGGGGLIVLPSLLVVGLPPHLAVSCNKFSACLGTGIALQTYAKSGLIQWKIALIGVGFALLGANIGTTFALSLDQQLFSKIILCLLPCALIGTLLSPKEKEVDQQPKLLLIPIICSLIGFYDGFFGPGTGSFLILAFNLFLKMNLLRASATAKVLNFASNLASTLTFIYVGTIYWPLALAMALASISGNAIGAHIAIRLGSQGVKKFLIFSLVILLLTLIAKI